MKISTDPLLTREAVGGGGGGGGGEMVKYPDYNITVFMMTRNR